MRRGSSCTLLFVVTGIGGCARRPIARLSARRLVTFGLRTFRSDLNLVTTPERHIDSGDGDNERAGTSMAPPFPVESTVDFDMHGHAAITGLCPFASIYASVNVAARAESAMVISRHLPYLAFARR